MSNPRWYNHPMGAPVGAPVPNVVPQPMINQPPAKQSHFQYSPSIDPTNYFNQVSQPPIWLTRIAGSKEKLNVAASLPHPRGGTLLQQGDVLRCSYMLNGQTDYKDIILIDLHIIGQNSTTRIAIPPQGYQRSEPHLRADLIFPAVLPTKNIERKEWLCPTRIFDCLIAVEPRAFLGNAWATISVIRYGEDLGNLWDIKQAQRFSENEQAFADSLMFLKRDRSYRWLAKKYLPGWYLADDTALFFKMRTADYDQYNQTGMLDFGDELNHLLASCADPGFTIVSYDMRMKIACDGIPVPWVKDLKVEEAKRDVLANGWNVFPTAYTRELAQTGFVSTWSQGHAHLGPLAFGKHPIGKKGDNLRLNGRIIVDNDPPGVDLTDDEKDRVDMFLQNFVQGRIMHWPLPIHRNGALNGGVVSYQYFVNNNHQWELDDRGPDMARHVLMQSVESEEEYDDRYEEEHDYHSEEQVGDELEEEIKQEIEDGYDYEY